MSHIIRFQHCPVALDLFEKWDDLLHSGGMDAETSKAWGAYVDHLNGCEECNKPHLEPPIVSG